MMKNNWAILIVIVIIVLGGFFLLRNQSTTPPATTTPTTTQAAQNTVVLAEQNASSESGTAVLTEKDGKTVVTLTMTGAPSGVSQPAHIHIGACPNVGTVAYPLTNVVNGVSETTLDVTLAELKTKQPLGINVHKSVPEASVYVSCGDLAL